MKKNNIELISFNLCPFVQRTVIALNEKGVEFDTTYIDIIDPPKWFKKISPMAKVPVLKMDDTVIFESMVIAEYLEEICAPQLHPSNAIEKARHRSWIEYGSEITMKQFSMFCATDEKKFMHHKADFEQQLNIVSKELDNTGPFFSGTKFMLIDTVYAPIFMRNKLFEQYSTLDLYAKNSRLDNWAQALNQHKSVINSVREDFYVEFVDYFRKEPFYIKNLLDRQSNSANTSN